MVQVCRYEKPQHIINNSLDNTYNSSEIFQTNTQEAQGFSLDQVERYGLSFNNPKRITDREKMIDGLKRHKTTESSTEYE